VTKQLADRRSLLARLVTHLDVIAQETGQRSTQLTETVRLARKTLDATTRRATSIERSMEPLGGVLSEAKTAFDDVNRLGEPLVPALRQLRPVARKLPSALTELRRTLPTVRGTLTDAQPLFTERVNDAKRLGRALAGVKPVANGLIGVTSNLNALVKQLADIGRNIAGFGNYWSGALSTQDDRLAVTRALFFKFDPPDPVLFGLPSGSAANRTKARVGALTLLTRACTKANLAACLALAGLKPQEAGR
jgi:ABC-type transporter Mla subunit MlaD